MRYLQNVVVVTPENVFGYIIKGREPGTLYAADRRDVALALTLRSYPVLIRLHEGNCDEDFSAWRYVCENFEEADDEYLEGVYRRILRLPWDILETERLRVRETTEADMDDFYRIYNDPAIARYLDPLYPEREREIAYLREYQDMVYAFWGFGIWTVIEKASNAVIGRAGISYREGFDDPDIGFVIEKDRRRCGYATEVCRAILNYAADTLKREHVLAFVRPDNAASIRVCEHLDMEPAGTARINGEEHIKYCWDKKSVIKKS